MTTENISVTPGSLDSASVHEISKIRLKDGTSIDCEGKIIKLIKDKDSALVLDISAYTVGSNFNTYWTYKQINASDILKIQLEKSVANTSATITLIVIGAVFLTACILIGNAMKDFHFNKPY